MKTTLTPSILTQSLGLAFAFTAATAAFGQTPPPPNQPDAGSLMGTMRHGPAAAPGRAPSFEVMQEVRPPLVAPGGIKVKVNSFKLSGNTVFTQAQLQALLGGYAGKELDMAGLEEAASVISQFYRDQGYFVARAYLPAQPIGSGQIEIAVIEGRLGAVKMERKGDVRLRQDVAQGIVTRHANLGAPIRDSNVERGLMLLNDLPGVEVKSTLVPGASLGTSDLVIETTQAKLYTGSVDVDNYGNKFSGVARVGATLNVNDPNGIGDQLILRAMTSELLGKNTSDGGGMRYLRGAYSLPVGRLGTKVGASLTGMNYTLGHDFKDLSASGNSSILGLYAVHPLLRSRNGNVYASVNYDDKRIQDFQLSTNRADKDVKALSLGLTADRRDGMGGGGLTSGSVSLTSGRLGLNNLDQRANDAITSLTNGAYNKISYNLARLQYLTDRWSFYGSLSGQYASKNLDSSEKFVLGGMGVRAYPQGEASGDEGLLLNLEARYSVPGWNSLQVLGFIDTGSITLHKNTWSGWQPTGMPNFPNSYTLSGYGLGANLYKEGDYSIRASVAWKLGSNPGADNQGRDADNGVLSPRIWLQATKQF